MSSYHTSFKYLNGDSYVDYNLIITHIENADVGLVDSYLSVDPVYRSLYDGTKRHLYGTKYNNVMQLEITVVHADYTEFSMSQTRDIYKWLTGSQKYSWMDLYEEDEMKYRMHCYVKDVKPYKMDARIVGFTIYVESSSPWCYSPPQKRTVAIVEDSEFSISCRTDDANSYVPLKVTYQRGEKTEFLYDEDGSFRFAPELLKYDNTNRELKFDGTVSYDSSTKYISLSSDKINDVDYLRIINKPNHAGQVAEVTNVDNVALNEKITLSENLMIQSDDATRIFGDDFNYKWPRLKDGINNFWAFGNGYLTFEYVLPMKVGDCVDNYIAPPQ